MSSRGAAEEQPHICHCEESLTLVKGEWTTKQSRASEASSQPYNEIAASYCGRTRNDSGEGIATPFGLSKKISFSFRRARFVAHASPVRNL